jgi:large subunit ribosomal protein L23
MKENRVVVKKAILTERTGILKDTDNKYVFEVNKDANKHEIKRTIENMFSIHITDVTTMSMHGKIKRLGRFQGRRPDWKKAIVTLKDGDKIELVEGS